MQQTRLFVNQPLVTGHQVQLDEKSSHYLTHVLRLRTGAAIHVFNGEGGCYRAGITAAEKRSVTILLRDFIDEERESGLDLVLIQGISRGQKMDYTIQKAVELGVNRILPVITEFSQVKLTAERADKRLAHWRGVAVSACEQCGRNRVPLVAEPVALADCPDPGPGARLMLVPDAGMQLAETAPVAGRVIVLIGPEGGLSENDRIGAEMAGFRGVALGPRVLRTETAAVAALTACQVLWGDLGRLKE